MPKTFACRSCGAINRAKADRTDAKCGRCHEALDVSGSASQVDNARLTALIASSPVPVLVDFYADWCGPCKGLSPILDALGRSHAGDLLVVKVNTDQDQQHAGHLGVQGIPAVFLFKDGKVVQQATGLRPPPFWEGMIKPYLAG